jgi:uncharacterized protein (TIGR02611 family)
VKRFLLRGGRVVIHTTVGTALLVAGLVMLVTPGPGIVTIVLGFAVLAREYDWADRAKRAVLVRIKDASTTAKARFAARRTARATGDDAVTDLRPHHDDAGPLPDDASSPAQTCDPCADGTVRSAG